MPMFATRLPRAGLLALTLAAPLAGLGLATPAHAQKEGFYNVVGNGPDGSPYTGTLAMHQVGLASWQVLWETSVGRYDGYAMSSKDTFAIGFTAGNQPGLAVYKVLPNGTLTGQWTLIGTAQIGTETLSYGGPPPAGGNATAPAAPAAPAQQRR